jgi:ABC-type nitrate/sulfonate/bicarbonate transport system permease component
MSLAHSTKSIEDGGHFVDGCRKLFLACWRLTFVRRVALILFILAVWQVVASLLQTENVPTVPHFFAVALDVVPTRIFWLSVAFTGGGWAAGLLISAALGIGFGIVVGISPVVDRATRIVILVLYAVPSITLVPLLLLLFGSTMELKILLVAISAVWPVILHAEAGVREVDAVAYETARSYRLAKRDVIFKLYLPSAVPIIATGIRVAATIALQISIATEVVAGVPGLGSQILVLSINAEDPATAFVYFVAAATLGLSISLLFRRLESMVLFWHVSQRKHRSKG